LGPLFGSSTITVVTLALPCTVPDTGIHGITKRKEGGKVGPVVTQQTHLCFDNPIIRTNTKEVLDWDLAHHAFDSRDGFHLSTENITYITHNIGTSTGARFGLVVEGTPPAQGAGIGSFVDTGQCPKHKLCSYVRGSVVKHREVVHREFEDTSNACKELLCCHHGIKTLVWLQE
jgi:hypothetical protein